MFSLHPKLIDFDLMRLKFLMDKFDNPQNSLNNVIHIAGTNGKGSTVAFIKAGLESRGDKVHVFTSPHLVDITERILIAGKKIDLNVFISFSSITINPPHGLLKSLSIIFKSLSIISFSIFSK